MREFIAIDSFIKLKSYCEQHDYKGFDVGDGATSWFLQHTFLNKIPFIRFCFLQLTGHRLALINLRPLLLVETIHNAKGIALFLNGYCNISEIIDKNKSIDLGISKEECIKKIDYLASLLISLGNKNFSGIGWGYPIIWQARDFSFPPNTPTAVATSFAVEALFHAYEITENEHYKDTALQSADFVLKSLNRTLCDDGFLFSYSPYKGNDGVYNASLLAARTLCYCYKYCANRNYLEVAKKVVTTCINRQQKDGSWVYGILPSQSWIDNFHTGYNLEAIQAYQDISGDLSYSNNLQKGFEFMKKNFFDDNDVPKYFYDKQYPIDIHCCGEILVVLYKMKLFKENDRLADNIVEWTIKNMFDEKRGYFYFQKRKLITNKCPLMRWSEAFMFNALSFYIKSKLNVY